jgi:hypothetical protein
LQTSTYFLTLFLGDKRFSIVVPALNQTGVEKIDMTVRNYAFDTKKKRWKRHGRKQRAITTTKTHRTAADQSTRAALSARA